MIDVTEVLMDPDFVTKFTVLRTAYGWHAGRIGEKGREKLTYTYPAHPATEQELEQLPEGDRKKEVMTFFCVAPHTFYAAAEDEADTPEQDADIYYDHVLYKGKQYKIVKVKDWTSHGWLRAYGVLTGPAEKEET